jgi:hypothetical protein
MSRILNGHLALASLGLLAAAAPFDRAAATPGDAPAISPAARWLQFAPPQRLAQKLEKTDKLDTRKLAPKIEKLDAPTRGSSTKSNLTPPGPKDSVNPRTMKLVVVQDPKFGALNVSPGAKAAYLSLSPSVRAQLSDPKGGAMVSEAALKQLASRHQFKPPPANTSTCGGAGQPPCPGSGLYW